MLDAGVEQSNPHQQQRLAAMGNWQHPGLSDRVIFTSEACVHSLYAIGQVIRVPPVRVRRSDLGY